MKYLAISRHSTIQLLLMIVASNAFVYQYNSVFIAILNPLNIHIDDLLTSYVVTGRFSIMGPLDNSIRFSTGWPMWAFTKAWAKLHMGFYEYIVHILLNYVPTNGSRRRRNHPRRDKDTARSTFTKESRLLPPGPSTRLMQYPCSPIS